jgi:6-hydroxycyclohex-1-ene-1-carbonyl-CoA dehydrogenase
MLSVVADAVTTPYEAIARADAGPDDLVVIIGAGASAGLPCRLAAARGATVVAIDLDDDRLALAMAHGATVAINPKLTSAKAMRDGIRALVRETGRGRIGTKIFEMSVAPPPASRPRSTSSISAAISRWSATPRTKSRSDCPT